MANRKEQKTNLVEEVEIYSEAQLAELRQRVTKSSGLIRIFVHPFFEENIDSPSWRSRKTTDEFPRIELSDLGLRRILSSNSEKSPPVLVIEERSRMEESRRRLMEYVGNGEKVYLLPSYRSNPTPDFITTRVKNEHLDSQMLMRAEWVMLSHILETTGVKKIILGGQRLIVEQGDMVCNRRGVSMDAMRCVGLVWEVLGRNFSIEISNFSHPHSRRDVENFDPIYYQDANRRLGKRL